MICKYDIDFTLREDPVSCGIYDGAVGKEATDEHLGAETDLRSHSLEERLEDSQSCRCSRFQRGHQCG